MPQEKNHQIILGLSHDEPTLKDVMLPPGSGLILSAKICSENVCDEIPSITIDVPSREISEEELRTRLEDIRALLTDEKYLDVISEFQVLLSISKSGGNWDQQKNGVCGAFYRGIITAMNDLASQNFTTESIFEANVILDALDESPCHFDNEVISENRTRALDAATELLANMDEAKKLQMDEERRKAAGEDEQELAAEMAGAFLSENLPENVFGAPKAGAGMWASCIRVLDPIHGETVQQISCGHVCHLNFSIYL